MQQRKSEWWRRRLFQHYVPQETIVLNITVLNTVPNQSSCVASAQLEPLTRYLVVCFRHKAVCVCVFSSHSFWTSSSLDVPAGVTQEEGHTGFLIYLLSAVRALIFLAKRIQPFLSLVDREVEFCVLTI